MKKNLKQKLYEIIFEADTPAGKLFDILLIVAIVISIIAVMVESVESVQLRFGKQLNTLEWVITLLFTVEYITRILVTRRPVKFIFSFYGIIDFLSFVPSYLGLFVTGTQGLMVIRALRLLRIFRVLKLDRYISESNYLVKALKQSRIKIGIFLYAVIMIIIIIGAVMYLVEGEQNGFDSIPRSMYWVIVTITTVGFGDITPQTTFGQFIAGFIMILGYAIIAVPTGIVTVEMGKSRQQSKKMYTRTCPECLKEGHDSDAEYCKFCGSEL